MEKNRKASIMRMAQGAFQERLNLKMRILNIDAAG